MALQFEPLPSGRKVVRAGIAGQARHPESANTYQDARVGLKRAESSENGRKDGVGPSADVPQPQSVIGAGHGGQRFAGGPPASSALPAAPIAKNSAVDEKRPVEVLCVRHSARRFMGETMWKPFLAWLLAMAMYAVGSPAHAAGGDCAEGQSFATGLGGWERWWSGDVVARASPGRTDDWALKLGGPAYGTAERDISPAECAQPLTRIAYYARAETGSALVYTKLVDQVTGATLWDADTGPIVVSSTAWTRIVVDVPMPNTTLIGIAAQGQGGGAVSVLVDDVELNPGVVSASPVQPDNVPVPVRSGWTLTFSDEFPGDALDPAKWAAITTGPTAGASTEGFGETWGAECYDASQVAVRDGSLRLTARQQAARCLGSTRSWLSGLVISRDRFSQAYGRFEARIRMPVARGSWPAFWMMPQRQQAWGTCGMYWPCGGEIDILEYVGERNASNATEPSAVYGTLHWGTPSGGQAQDAGSAKVLPSVDRWTVYAAEWDKTGISFFVDDVLVRKVAFPLPDSAGLYTGAQPFTVPFYFILNQSVGGDWPGTPDPADYPSTVKIDYVAAYRRS